MIDIIGIKNTFVFSPIYFVDKAHLKHWLLSRRCRFLKSLLLITPHFALPNQQVQISQKSKIQEQLFILRIKLLFKALTRKVKCIDMQKIKCNKNLGYCRAYKTLKRQVECRTCGDITVSVLWNGIWNSHRWVCFFCGSCNVS